MARHIGMRWNLMGLQTPNWWYKYPLCSSGGIVSTWVEDSIHLTTIVIPITHDKFRLILSLLTMKHTAITMLNQFFTLETREGLDPLQTRQLRLKPLTCPGWIRSKMPGTWVAGCSWVLCTISQRASVWTKRGGTSSGPWCKLTKPENSQFLGKP